MRRLSTTCAVLLVVVALAACGKSKKELAAEAEKQRVVAEQIEQRRVEAEQQAAEAKQRAETAHAEKAEQESKASETARLSEKVSNTLKDPGSAQFRNLELNVERKVLCGQVNAKNAFGGYVGFRRFVSSDDGVEIEGERKTDRTEDLISRILYLSAASKAGCPTGEP
jgi:hypothetical protein